jgi:plastocyanin
MQAESRSGWLRMAGVPALATLAVFTSAEATAQPALTPTPAPGKVHVKVWLQEVGGARAPGNDAVAWLEGLRRPDFDPRQPQKHISQRDKHFDPTVEVVRVGDEVDFPNLDRVFHNVFSLSEVAKFDLGLYRRGASRTVRFERPGVVRIYCNIHPQMAAFLVVVRSDFAARAPATGEVLLDGVPPGRHLLKVWHPKAEEQGRDVEVTSGQESTIEVALDVSGWHPQGHKNKYGQDYPPPDDDSSRY